MKKNLEHIEKISRECSEKITYYRYNDHLPYSLKYKKGRITSATWINEICFYFIQKEKRFLNEFINILEKKAEELDQLNNGDYKQGLLDEINEIKKSLKN